MFQELLDAICVGSLEEKNICFLFLRKFLGIFHFFFYYPT